MLFFNIGDLKDSLEDGCRTVDSKEEYSQLTINELYEVVNEIEVYAILNIEEKNVVDMLRPFFIIMKGCKTVISHAVWKNHCKSKVKDAKLSLPEIAASIWAPCFQEIQQIVEKFHSKSVSLQEIDYYLKDILPQNLRQEVLSLAEGCNKCLSAVISNRWISQFVMSVNKYRVIC